MRLSGAVGGSRSIRIAVVGAVGFLALTAGACGGGGASERDAIPLPLAVPARPLPTAERGVPYPTWLAARGGLAPHPFAIAPASAPLAPRHSLTSDGRTAGTPSGAGRATFAPRVEVEEATGEVAAAAAMTLAGAAALGLANVVDRVDARGRVRSGADEQALLRILPRAAGEARDPALAAALVAALVATDTRERRLGAHHVFDAARRCGYLDETLVQLRRAHGANPVVNDLIGQAQPTRTPNVISHRGMATDQPENTMPAIRAAVDAGATGLEIDVTITADDRLVLWHDYDQGGIVPLVRNLGFESGMGFRPILPGLGTAARRPIHELDLATVRRHFGYAPRDAGIGTDRRADVEIPELAEVARYAAAHPELKEIVVDVKLPPDRPDLHARFASQLDDVLRANGLEGRVTILHNDAGVVRNLKRGMGEGFAFSHDVEIVSLAPSADNYSGARSARALGNTVASIGRPRIGIDAYDVYLEALKRDRQAVDSAARPTRLVTWTINDELELREVLAIGVDGIITDDPELLNRLLETYGLDK